MPTWTCAAAANRAANSACSTATSRRISTTSSNGSARQPWSNGKVGGIGQSYFCMLQWWMAIQKPPSLACIAAFDGLNDPYRASVYQGGILGDFFGSYWWNQNRIINRNPANGEHPREQNCDLNLLRAAASDLRRFLARTLRGGAAARDRGAALFGRRLGQGRSAHPRQHRWLPPRRRSEKAEDGRPRQCLRRQPRIQQRRTARKAAAAVLRSLSQRPNHQLRVTCAGRVLRSRRQCGACRRKLAAAGRALCDLEFERTKIRQRHLAQRRHADARAGNGRGAHQLPLSRSGLDAWRCRLRAA